MSEKSEAASETIQSEMKEFAQIYREVIESMPIHLRRFKEQGIHELVQDVAFGVFKLTKHQPPTV